MKSSDSRTNSKYKSPYGCRTNSHCDGVNETQIGSYSRACFRLSSRKAVDR